MKKKQHHCCCCCSCLLPFVVHILVSHHRLSKNGCMDGTCKINGLFLPSFLLFYTLAMAQSPQPPHQAGSCLYGFVLLLLLHPCYYSLYGYQADCSPTLLAFVRPSLFLPSGGDSSIERAAKEEERYPS